MATVQLIQAQVAIRNVLVATDFSRRSNFTLNFGVDFARRYGAQTYILHVLSPQEYAMAGPEAVVAAQDAARRDLLDLKQQLRAGAYTEGADYHLLLGEGDIAESILDCARDEKIDLIVLGTHGRGGFSRALLGSVAEHVFRHSKVPVLTLGPGVLRPAQVAPQDILVPVDFTGASRTSAAYACSLAREHGGKVTLLHVVQKVPCEAAADLQRLQEGVIEHLEQLVHGCAEKLMLEYRVELGKAAPAILRVASETGTHLIVLGVHSLPNLLDRIRWQVAYDVAREAACPVLTVRAPA